MGIFYLAGLVCFFLSKLGAGISLWAISTVGGFLLLRFLKDKDERDAKKSDEKDDASCE